VAKRQRARERRREKRRSRGEATGVAPPPRKPEQRTPGRSVSWLGVLGGLSGALAMAALALDIIAAPPEDVGVALAAVPIAMAALYTPAIWASLARTNARQAILRLSVLVSLAMAFAGSFVFGLVVLVVLLPTTILLWLASGGPRPPR
jgi:hypothetical protein